jgi:hypothetical protein
VTHSERKEIRVAFRQAANMARRELERWLATEESQSVGWTRDGDDEAVGHQSGRRVVELKRKKVAELSDSDYAHMEKVIGYVHRHKAQPPKANRRRAVVRS